MTLRVITPGFLTTVQDMGRFGYQRYGVPPSGAMDWFAMQAANRLVGNARGAAGLEFTLDPPELLAEVDCLVACAGRGFDLWVAGRWVGMWYSAYVRRGEVIQLGARPGGGWGYLAVAGGIDVAPVLGARATYVRGGLGGVEGRPLKPGDRLPVGPRTAGPQAQAGAQLIPQARLAYGDDVTLDVVLGPQEDAFTSAGRAVFTGSPYQVSAASDRTGYRLVGEPIEHRGVTELLSEGMAHGAVQVPADGQPIVMMADRPTTGGYPKIATVARASLPLLAQCPPGGSVRFRAVSVQAAREAYQRLLANMTEGIDGGDD